MSDHAEEDYEDVTMYDLDPEVEEELLAAHNECTFIWVNREGWPVGVIMSYIWRNGRFWLTASSQRARISAVRHAWPVMSFVSGSPRRALTSSPALVRQRIWPEYVRNRTGRTTWSRSASPNPYV